MTVLGFSIKLLKYYRCFLTAENLYLFLKIYIPLQRVLFFSRINNMSFIILRVSDYSGSTSYRQKVRLRENLSFSMRNGLFCYITTLTETQIPESIIWQQVIAVPSTFVYTTHSLLILFYLFRCEFLLPTQKKDFI